MSRTILLGATGYTGRLIAERLLAGVTDPAEVVLAGRSAAALAELAETLGGPPTAVVDLGDPATITRLLGPGDVLATTVGSFVKRGDVALEAAIASGAHYLDTTGEAPFVRRVFEHPGAVAARGALVTAMGFNYAPGNLAGALALDRATAPVDRLDIGYFLNGEAQGALSGGTLASATGVLLSPSFTHRDGALRTERCGARTRTRDVDGARVRAMTLGSSEAITLPALAPSLRVVDTYQGGLGPATPVVAQVGRLAGVPLLPRVADALGGRLMPGSTGGPDTAERARAGTHVAARAFDAAGHPVAEVVLRGPNVYDVTADLVVWAAQRAAAGEVHGRGPLGPVQAFGLEALRAAHLDAGIKE
jgi:short subunit dehydrogenase-like uncharacterized protein